MAEIAKPMEPDKRKKAMQGRLRKLGTDNPVVKKAIEKNKPTRDAYEDFDIVHELVSASYSEYAEGSDKSLHDCLINLADAIRKAANSLPANKKGGSNDTDPDDY